MALAGGEDGVDHGFRIRRPGPFVALGLAAERLGDLSGVVHRHFVDFDTFLAELILDRAAQLDATATEVAGSGTVIDNLTEALTAVFTPFAVAVVALVITRDGLRERLRQAVTARFPLLAEGTAMVTGYLTEEQALGRVATTTDVPTLSHMLIGSVHLLFSDRESGAPETEALRKVVATVMQGTVQAKGRRLSAGTIVVGSGRMTAVSRAVHVPYTIEQDEDGVWCASAQLRVGVGAGGDGETQEAAVADLREALAALIAEVGAPPELTVTLDVA